MRGALTWFNPYDGCKHLLVDQRLCPCVASRMFGGYRVGDWGLPVRVAGVRAR